MCVCVCVLGETLDSREDSKYFMTATHHPLVAIENGTLLNMAVKEW